MDTNNIQKSKGQSKWLSKRPNQTRTNVVKLPNRPYLFFLIFFFLSYFTVTNLFIVYLLVVTCHMLNGAQHMLFTTYVSWND